MNKRNFLSKLGFGALIGLLPIKFNTHVSIAYDIIGFTCNVYRKTDKQLVFSGTTLLKHEDSIIELMDKVLNELKKMGYTSSMVDMKYDAVLGNGKYV